MMYNKRSSNSLFIQTGTGKTYSMQGVPNVPHLRGIIPTCFHHIFNHISTAQHKKFLVRASFLEIYNEEVKDLLIKANKNPKGGLDVKEHPETGVYVRDLSAFVVKNVLEMEHLMDVGNKNRSVGSTLMNENSSRSHSIFSITIESSEPGPDGEDRYVSGKLNLVDLAGSERLSKTGASGDRLKEATKINLSLSALGNCISALVDSKSTHIPYRDSKLTRLLQDSLGGNAKTLMIATLSPASYNFEETLSTLRYANRAKSIKNKPTINEDPKDAMLREYQQEIEMLQQALKARQNGGSGSPRKVIKKIVTKKAPKLVPKKEQDGEFIDDLDKEGEDDDENEGNDDIAPISVLDAETIARLQAEVDSEKQKLLASKDIVTEEKQRIAAELDQKSADLEHERMQRVELAQKLLGLEAKLIIGGVTIVEKVNEQEKKLQEAHFRLQEQQRRERELHEKLEARQEAQLQLEESFSSLQEEVDVKTKNLKKLWAKLQEVKTEISDGSDEFRLEREDLLDTVRDLTREISLKRTIIENFIPIDEKIKIEKKMSYDEENEDWVIKKATFKGIQNRHIKRTFSSSAPALRRPVSQYAKIVMGLGDPNTRYRYDNIVSLQVYRK